MPNVTLHLLLAERVLETWSSPRRSSPGPRDRPLGRPRDRLRDRLPRCDLDAPPLRHAFRLGAFGPDLGYFPGGDPFLSNLAHCVGSGTLTRELMERATTPLEQAFALGWMTHVIADRQLHPVVGRGVADVRRATRPDEDQGNGIGFISADADPTGHVRVETGIDAWISRLYPRLRRERFVPIFDVESIPFLSDAYSAVYGVDFAPEAFLASHRATAEMSSRALAAIGLLSARSERPTSRLGAASLALAQGATGILGKGSLALAFVSPLPPPPWLRIAVAEEVVAFVPHVEAALEDPDACLVDVNLDTGRPDGLDQDHETTRDTLRILEALRGEMPAHGGVGARGGMVALGPVASAASGAASGVVSELRGG